MILTYYFVNVIDLLSTVQSLSHYNISLNYYHYYLDEKFRLHSRFNWSSGLGDKISRFSQIEQCIETLKVSNSTLDIYPEVIKS